MAEATTSSGGATTSTTHDTSTDRQRARRPQQSNDREQSADAGIVDRVRQSATQQLTNQKDRGIDALGSVAGAVRSSTQRLRDEQHDTIAGYVEKAADQIETWSRRLKEKDIDELLTDVQRLARRQPAVFIGSAFALGVVGARFLKSTQPQNDYSYGSESRRNVYRASQMSTAGDRGTWRDEADDAGVVAGEVAVADLESDDTRSPAGTGGSRSGRAPRSKAQTERS